MKQIKILLFVFLFIFVRSEAADLHVLMVCDTNDSSIGATIHVDIEKMDKQLQAIKRNTGLNLNVIHFAGTNANPNHVLKAIESLETAEDDVILFYFSGHGFRMENKENALPYLFFGTTFQGCDFYTFTQMLLEKEPRLLIALSDCCNSFVPEDYAPEIVKNLFYDWWWGNAEKNYKKLFLETEGVFIGMGCAKGEYSICNNTWGGFFTHAFCESLGEIAYAHSDPEWEHVIDELAKGVGNLSQNEQHPYCFFIPTRASKDLDLSEYIQVKTDRKETC